MYRKKASSLKDEAPPLLSRRQNAQHHLLPVAAIGRDRRSGSRWLLESTVLALAARGRAQTEIAFCGTIRVPLLLHLAADGAHLPAAGIAVERSEASLSSAMGKLMSFSLIGLPLEEPKVAAEEVMAPGGALAAGSMASEVAFLWPRRNALAEGGGSGSTGCCEAGGGDVFFGGVKERPLAGVDLSVPGGEI